MALVVYGGGVTDLSGSIGGNTFSRNASGAYVRSKSIPVNPQTARQYASRGWFTAASTIWQNTLTELQRQAWRDYAAATGVINRLGQTIYLSGLNMFLRTLVARGVASSSAILDAPIDAGLGESPGVLSGTISEATNELTLAFDDTKDWCDEDDSDLLVQVGTPQGSSIAYFNGPYRYAEKVEGDGTTAPTSPATISCPFVCSQYQRVWIRARIAYADGRLTSFSTAGPITVAA